MNLASMLAAAKNKKNIECPWCCVCVCFEFNSPCEVSLKVDPSGSMSCMWRKCR